MILNPRAAFAQIQALFKSNTADDQVTVRARARGRRIAASAGTALAAKLISVAVALLTVPLTLKYLGPERYGMWLILSSLLTMSSFADLGIGNGVLSTVATAYGRDDVPAIRRTISSGFGALSGVAMVIMAVFAVLYQHIAWNELFNVSTPLARSEAGPSIAVFIVCMALAIPCGIVQRVQMGLQQSFLANLWQCGGSIVSLTGVLLSIRLEAGLPWLVFAFVAGPLVANAVNTVVFFGWYRRDIAPHPRFASLASARSAISYGSHFVLIQLGNSVTAGCVPIIVAHVVGPQVVAQYAVPERLLALVVLVVSMYVQPLWPAFREALVRGDGQWVVRTYRRTFAAVLGTSTIMLVAIGFAMPLLLREWVGTAVHPPSLLVAGLCVYKIGEAIMWTNAILLNGLDALALQTAMALATATGVILLGLAVCMIWGVSIIPWSGAAVLMFLTLVPGSIAIRRRLAQIDKGEQ